MSDVRYETVSDYAQRVGVSENTVYRKIANGKLKAAKRAPFGRGSHHWIIETPFEFVPLRPLAKKALPAELK